MSNKSGVATQVLPLPTGGGALRGIGDTFKPDLFTGTGHFSIPISLPCGRNGFQPSLNLVYSSGAGNGPFGLGWRLDVPDISRNTSKGVPRYSDDTPQRPDTFVLSGAEELVPVGERDGLVQFRPRTEGLFANIEHVFQGDQDNDFWRVRSRDGLISVFGTPNSATSDPAVIADPTERRRVYCWKLVETRDSFGNRIQYSYLRDSITDATHHSDQLYLQQVRYVDLDPDRFFVSITFEYESRPDSFSTCRAGFEICTALRCRRLLVHTHPDNESILLRTYELRYADDGAAGGLPTAKLPLNGVSLLSQVMLIGDDRGEPESLPPLEFSYSQLEPSGQAFEPLVGKAFLPPEAIGHEEFETVDLFGNGLPDVVQMGVTTRFWRNLGNGLFDEPEEMPEVPLSVQLKDSGVQLGDYNGDGRADLLVQNLSAYFPLTFKGRFRPTPHPVASMPLFNLEDPDVRFVDVDGDGVIDIMATRPEAIDILFNDRDEGFFDLKSIPRVHDLTVFPDISFSSDRVKFADLNGDGLQDIVVVAQGSISYWPYMGNGRWGHRVDMPNSPRVTDPTVETGDGLDAARLLFGDFDGDGLEDAVYIQPGQVTIWLNVAGQQWSKPTCFSNDGSSSDGSACIATPVPILKDIDDIRVIDMLGNGSKGLLWTTVDVVSGKSDYQFLDVSGGVKAYLLVAIENHMGAITRVQYGPSTKSYLADEKKNTTKWKTPLPAPVHVVERVEIIDELSKGKLTTEYRYRHGYWDGTEREFRGFGMVEQLDSETFEDFNAGGLHVDTHSFDMVGAHQFSPPTVTKTWFHLGDIADETLEGNDGASLPELDLSVEYFQDDPPLLPRPQDQLLFLSQLPTHGIRREALRTLRGSVMRTEVYAVNNSKRPLTVTETLTGLREVEKPTNPESTRKRIFFPHLLAQRTTRWESGNDPMTRFRFAEEYDEFGQSRRETTIACPRGWRRLEDTSGEQYLATQIRREFARSRNADVFIVDRVAHSTSFEVVNFGGQRLVDLKEQADSGSALKIIGQTLSFYDGPAFVGLAHGEVGNHGTLVRSETLVLTEEILHAAYKSDVESDSLGIPPYLTPDGPLPWTPEYPQEFRAHVEGLPHLAGYTFHSGDDIRARGYFASVKRNRYDFQVPGTSSARGLLRTVRDVLGPDPAPGETPTHDTTIDYDEFDLLPVRVTDPVGLVTEAQHDTRVLQPSQVIDPNGNRTHYTYTPLGLLKDIAVLGKAGEFAGDEEQLPDGVIREVPSTRFTYDFLAFLTSPPEARMPIAVHTVRRVHHVSETDVEDPIEREKTVQTVEYSDGMGRLLQTRTLAEDDTVGDATFGGAVLSADQVVDPGDVVLRGRASNSKVNVVVSGAHRFDNKGRVIERFEPYFELESGFEYRLPGNEQRGKKITMSYDPLGRLVRTISPDGSEQRVIHGVPGSIQEENVTTPDVFEPTPWETYTYDANDLAPLSHAPLPDGNQGPPLSDRAPRHHHFTPSSIVVDALGRPIVTVARNRHAPDKDDDPLPLIQLIETRMEYDIRGNVLKVVDARDRDAFLYVYDLGNNVLRSQNIDAGTRRVVLDAASNEAERRDGKGALILQVYDPLHRLTRLWARDNDTSDVTVRERLVYGDDTNRAVNRSVNRLGALHLHYDEAGLVELAAYDFKGNIIDKSRRVIRDDAILAVFPDSGDPDQKWNISAFRVNWDPQEVNREAMLAVEPYRTSLTYDALNRVKMLVYPQDVDGVRKELQPTYNSAGALESLRVAGQVFVRHIAYDAKGQRTFVAFGNNVMTLYSYQESTFRLSRMLSTRFSIVGERIFRPKPLADMEDRRNNLHQDLGYDYDLIGNISRIRDRTPESGILNSLRGRDALDRVFSYDAIHRLIAATGREVDRATERRSGEPFDPRPRGTDLTKARAYRERYLYDAVGNLDELNHAAFNGRSLETTFVRRFTHKPSTNQLAFVVSDDIEFKYSYDRSGNVVGETTSRHFELDHSDRMKVFRTQVDDSEPSLYAHYLYDAAGERVMKVIRNQGGDFEATVYVDGVFEDHRWGNVRAGMKANSRINVMNERQRVASIRVGPSRHDDASPAVQFQTGDHCGSVNLVVDADGIIVNREEYTPYGETSFGSFRRKKWRFTGMERDEESGLCYHGQRYYAPWLVRWSSPDSLGANVGPNAYQYVHSNPLIYVDPVGTQPAPPEASGGPARGSYGAGNGNKIVEYWDDGAAIVHGVNGAYYYYQAGAGHATARWEEDVGWLPLDESGALAIAGETVEVTGTTPEESTVGTRVWGAIKVVGGAVEAKIGAALMLVPGGQVGGALLFAHGADVAGTGLRQVWTGEETRTATSQGISWIAQRAGASEVEAVGYGEFGEIGLSLGATSAGTKVLKLAGIVQHPGPIEIIGKPQRTTQAGAATKHASESVRAAWELADNDTIRIFYNKALHTVTRGATASKKRPDVALEYGTRANSNATTFTAVEVLSPTENAVGTVRAHLKAMLRLKERAEGVFLIRPR